MCCEIAEVCPHSTKHFNSVQTWMFQNQEKSLIFKGFYSNMRKIFFLVGQFIISIGLGVRAPNLKLQIARFLEGCVN